MRPGWSIELLRLALALAAGAVLGALAGGLWMGLFLALAGYTAWHLWQLYRLDRWFRNDRRRDPPIGSGIWGRLFDHYHHLQQRHARRKRKLAGALREFRESTAATPDGAMVMDRHDRMIWFNQAAQSMLGLRGNRDVCQYVGNLVRAPEFLEQLKSGRTGEAIEIPSPRFPDRWLSLRLIPYGDGHRLLLLRDVTRVHRLERMRRDFVANASHELRSPLTVVQGYLETLSEDVAPDSTWRHPIDEMERQARRMNSILEDLLHLSRLETEEPSAPLERIELQAMVERVRDDALALGVGPTKVGIDLDPGRTLLGAPDEIHSALANLVFNAMRHTPEDGRVTVSWRVNEDGEGILTVADTGSGVDPRHIPYITQRFYRSDPGRSRRHGGTGLGLAIVKHVLQRHAAWLDIESEPGQGSQFRCVFPPERVA